jgi:hypothetical protein
VGFVQAKSVEQADRIRDEIAEGVPRNARLVAD